MNLSLKTLVKIYGPVICFIILTSWYANSRGMSMYELVADPMEVANRASYTGLFSQVSNLLWGATTAICLFSTNLLHRQERKNNDRSSSFLLYSGLLSALLLLDDLLQLHEKAGRVLYPGRSIISGTEQSIAELIVFAIYGAAFIAFVLTFRKLILRSRPIFLIFAVIFFGLSTIIDMTPESLLGHHLFEESFKLLGIVSWFAYFFRFAMQKIQQQSEHFSKRTFQNPDIF